MKIYYKENTGLKTVQDEKTDYFTIDLDSIKVMYSSKKWSINVLFWERLEHAQGEKPANIHRTVEGGITKEANIENLLETILNAETLQTTNGETITLQNPKLVE